MKHSRIDDIYISFTRSQEYNDKFMDFAPDLSFLEEKLTNQEMRELERVFFSFCALYEKNSFQCGFDYAWELFHECCQSGHLRE